jgi:hypothetical protein
MLKIVRNNFERAKHGPKGKYMDVFCKPITKYVGLPKPTGCV